MKLGGSRLLDLVRRYTAAHTHAHTHARLPRQVYLHAHTVSAACAACSDPVSETSMFNFAPVWAPGDLPGQIQSGTGGVRYRTGVALRLRYSVSARSPHTLPPVRTCTRMHTYMFSCFNADVMLLMILLLLILRRRLLLQVQEPLPG